MHLCQPIIDHQLIKILPSRPVYPNIPLCSMRWCHVPGVPSSLSLSNNNCLMSVIRSAIVLRLFLLQEGNSHVNSKVSQTDRLLNLWVALKEIGCWVHSFVRQQTSPCFFFPVILFMSSGLYNLAWVHPLLTPQESGRERLCVAVINRVPSHMTFMSLPWGCRQMCAGYVHDDSFYPKWCSKTELLGSKTKNWFAAHKTQLAGYNLRRMLLFLATKYQVLNPPHWKGIIGSVRLPLIIYFGLKGLKENCDTYHWESHAELFSTAVTIRAPWLGGLDHVARTIAFSWLRMRSPVSLSTVTTQRLPALSSEMHKCCIGKQRYSSVTCIFSLHMFMSIWRKVVCHWESICEPSSCLWQLVNSLSFPVEGKEITPAMLDVVFSEGL